MHRRDRAIKPERITECALRLSRRNRTLELWTDRRKSRTCVHHVGSSVCVCVCVERPRRIYKGLLACRNLCSLNSHNRGLTEETVFRLFVSNLVKTKKTIKTILVFIYIRRVSRVTRTLLLYPCKGVVGPSQFSKYIVIVRSNGIQCSKSLWNTITRR